MILSGETGWVSARICRHDRSCRLLSPSSNRFQHHFINTPHPHLCKFLLAHPEVTMAANPGEGLAVMPPTAASEHNLITTPPEVCERIAQLALSRDLLTFRLVSR